MSFPPGRKADTVSRTPENKGSLGKAVMRARAG